MSENAAIMSKRLTDTNKYRKPFIRGLQGAYKLLWDYLYHDCDHAGIWIVDFEIAQVYLGQDMKVNKSDALKFFNDSEIRIVELENATKWFIVPFIEFQYGILNDQNRAHNSVIQILRKFNLWDENIKNINKGLIRPLEGCKDMDIVIVKDKDKDQEAQIEKITTKLSFTDFWDLYDKKRGDKVKLEKKWNELSKKDQEAIMLYIPKYKDAQPNKVYRKDPSTFLNNKSWNDEIISTKNKFGKVTGSEDPVDKMIRECNEIINNKKTA
jgi:hypothetical protein